MKSFKKISLWVVFLGLMLVFATPKSWGESSPQFLVSWRAQTYVPADFKGKVMPTSGSPVEVGFEMISQGRLVNLSQNEIYWYLDDDFVKGGVGLQGIVFRPLGVGQHNLRIKLPDYQGQSLTKNVVIPTVKPEAVIVAPFPQGKFTNPKIRLKGEAYFFNVDSLGALSLNWAVNGQGAKNSGDNSFLDISLGSPLGSGLPLNVSLNVRNPRSLLEMAGEEVLLNFSK
ncbi:MAG: hypothetical protein HY093_02440 [Candidatus Liptonbacteria bacterium]|nr:hypothetical protein [Candidatus Liptonbacteria bacterium]